MSNVSRRFADPELTSELDDTASVTHLPKIFIANSGANSMAKKHLLEKSSHSLQKQERYCPNSYVS